MLTTFYGLTAKQKQWLKQNHPHLKLQHKSGSLTLTNLPSRATEIVSIHSDSGINQALLKHLPKLKLIITRTAGVDHIDLAACQRSNVAVVNSSKLNSIAVAEFTFGLILSYLRDLPNSIAVGRQLKFNSAVMEGGELNGKTLGVVGTGAIGSHVARIAKGFGMNILAYDAKRNLSQARQLNMRYLSLKQLVQKADIVSLHVPATPLTEQMINRALLSQFKTGAILVNMARGSVIDSKAVINALNQNRLAGYLADVLQNEQQLRGYHGRLSPKDRLIIKLQKQLAKHPRVWLTPHIAHATEQSMERILEHCVQIIQHFQQGKKISSII